MTVVSVLSLKGAPGVTTLSCLLATTWPTTGPVLVVEADPAGGDLAVRFGLSGALGRQSLAAAVRRTGMHTPLEPHLQALPGGLPVLVGSGGDIAEPDMARCLDVVDGSVTDGLGVVDLGRWHPNGPSAGHWLERSDGAVVVVEGDAASAMHLRTGAPRLLEVTKGRLGVVVVGGGDHDCAGVASFTAVRPLGDLPFDVPAASVVSGSSGAVRRLERSSLLAAVRRVADEMARLIDAPECGAWNRPGEIAPLPPTAKRPTSRHFAVRWPRRRGEVGKRVMDTDALGPVATDVHAAEAASTESGTR